MDNAAIAHVLAEIGDLLEIKGANPFKIRAYRNASETVAVSAEPVADLSEVALLAIPGIGKDLAAKIPRARGDRIADVPRGAAHRGSRVTPRLAASPRVGSEDGGLAP